MLYYKALINGLSPLPPANLLIRNKIYKIFLKKGCHFLHLKLSKIDLESSKIIHPNDFKRIQRAIEVFLVTGKTLTELKKISGKTLPYKTWQFAILPKNKNFLYKKIKNRIDIMLSLGFENEVKKLFNRTDLNIKMPSISCIGYRQMWKYLLGELTYTEMINQINYATKKLVKKQITWLKSWKNINIINEKNINSACNIILNKIKKK